MNNIMKRTILLIIITLGILVLPKHVGAVNLKVNDDYTLHSKDFLRNDVFCAQHGQKLFFPDRPIPCQVIRKITINRSNVIVEESNRTETITEIGKVDQYQQLAYILSLKNTYIYENWEDYQNRPKQKLIWHHLHKTEILGITCNDSEYDEGIYEKATNPLNYKYCTGVIFVLENKEYSWEAFKEYEAGRYGKGGAQHIIMAEGQMDKKPIANVNIKKTSNEVEKYQQIDGAQFNVSFKNIGEGLSLKGYSGNIVNDTEYSTTAGEIDISNISGNGNKENDPIEITLEELQAPNGYKISKKTTKIYIKQDCSQYKKDNGAWINISDGATINVNIENQPLINLSGNVWQDGQIGEKVVSGPNGIKDEYYRYEKTEPGKGSYIAKIEKDGSITFEEAEQGKGDYKRISTIKEPGVKGILVELYNADENGKRIGERVAYAETNQYGNYEFKGINKTDNGYKVVFKYDGINYEATYKDAGSDDSVDSDVEEKNRNEINANFKTITAGQSNLKYDYNENEKKSALKTNMNGTNPGNDDAPDFQIEAETGVYKESNSNITCGLVKKEFDLSLGTDVKSATLKINDKETTYSYAQIMNGEMEDLTLDKILQNNSSTSNIIYNLYLYKSDYNYRISDYNSEIENGTNPGTPDGGYKATDGDEENDRIKELEAYVTYSVILKNQSTHEATVDQFVYYYDAAYTPYNIESTNEYDVSIDTNTRKITFTSKNGGLSVNAPDYRKEIDLTFKVNKNEQGYVELKDNCTNIAEITKYSTVEGGLIDKDSAPGNGIKDGKITQDEDDTDQAKGLTISLKENEVRTITGTVFEDTNKDGILNDNKPVDDVIVQLIEVKKISGKYYEYIWQQTRSGSSEVDTIARNGYEGVKYKNNIQAESGQYEFKDYIPGNYIIRYIYGDGTTYDVTDNVKTYNGQDYKSTVDSKYKEPWYNTAGYESGYSVARDNEARRLEVMAYSATIDKTNGEALERRNKEDLSNTWMCAETSRINVPVDATVDAEKPETDSTQASYEYTKNKETIGFPDMNFGLAERPKTNLVLEKHITGLKITPNGTGVQSIVDAKADIEKIVNGTEVGAEGVTTGLATIKSTRGNRGFWQVATDIEELAQGAQLEVEYTYVIRNDSEKDYLSKTLIDAYKDKDTKPYAETLSEIKDTVKGTMRNGTYSYNNSNIIGKYLGQTYYLGPNEDGSVPDTDAEVSSRIETLQEALNNSLTFDKETSGEDFDKKEITDEKETMKTIYDTSGNPKEEKITTIIANASPTDFLTGKSEDNYTQGKDVDYSKTVTLKTVLSSSTGGELGANIPSYIAEVVKYSNAAGRRDMDAEPENLSYVHSDDTEMTMENSNERDEFWGETIIIGKPFGEDKLTPIQIAIITVSSMAVIGVGIVLIKKFVLKK